MIEFYLKLQSQDIKRIYDIIGTDLTCYIPSSVGRFTVNVTPVKIIFSKLEFEGVCRVEDLVADKLIMLR